MVDETWQAVSERFPTVELGNHVIMPNHLHGIITLTTTEIGELRDDSPSLSDVVLWFKRQTIRQYADGVRHHGWPPYDGRLWQGGFMDHVIRNEREWHRLTTYIQNNVAIWEDDTFHPWQV